MVRAIVTGAAGRMGKAIISIIQVTEGIKLVGAIEKDGNPQKGFDAGEVAGCGTINIKIESSLANIIDKADVVIDFTTPEATLLHLKDISSSGKGTVIGTTGFSEEDMAEVKRLTLGIPYVISPNMSVGVNVLFKIVADVSKILGNEYDVEIVEAHHRLKKDAPSGTAMRIAEIVADSLGRDLSKVGKFSRCGLIGERNRREIGVQSLRAGDIAGDHTILFGGVGERLEITHRAHNRDNFARGAVRAAQWVVNQKSGAYDMLDVIGLRNKTIREAN